MINFLVVLISGIVTLYYHTQHYYHFGYCFSFVVFIIFFIIGIFRVFGAEIGFDILEGGFDFFLTDLDNNPEHLRWRYFLEELKKDDSPDKLIQFYRESLKEVDINVRGSMMKMILTNKNCPSILKDEMLKLTLKHLDKILKERVIDD